MRPRRKTKRTCSGKCRMRLARASAASTADAATSRPRAARTTTSALDYDGLPRIPGGPRFWRELEQIVVDKILDGLDVDEFSSLGAERDAKKTAKQLRVDFKLGIHDALEKLQYEARNIRRRARSGAAVFGAPTTKRTKDEINNAYDTLRLDRTATSADARRAYHRLARYYHPDINDQGGGHFATVRGAYEIVRDDLTRRGR